MALNITYRSDLDRPLTSSEVDANFRTLQEAVAALQEGGGGIVDPKALVDDDGTNIVDDDGTQLVDD